MNDVAPRVAHRVAARYAAIAGVEAVAWSGSHAATSADPASDVDLYVYSRVAIPLEQRSAIARESSGRVEVGNARWEPGDEWIDRDSGIAIDVMFRDVRWIEDQLDRVLVRHEASLGYSTAFWHNVRVARSLFDRGGWFAALQQRADAPYPAELQRAVVALNHPVLRDTISSYAHQMERALARGDGVSLNHRSAALLASYFDIVFAANSVPHPGEKRLLSHVRTRCLHVPVAMEHDVAQLLECVGSLSPDTMTRLHRLVDGLDALLERVDLLPARAA